VREEPVGDELSGSDLPKPGLGMAHDVVANAHDIFGVTVDLSARGSFQLGDCRHGHAWPNRSTNREYSAILGTSAHVCRLSPLPVTATARAVADRFGVFRYLYDRTRPYGAEDGEYAAVGARLPPKNGPFQDKAELDQVLGITAEVRELLAPFVTVHSQQHGVDHAVAPDRLKQAIANRLPIAHSQRLSFAIDAVVSSPRGAYHRHAVVRILGKADEPFVITEWSRGSAESAAFLRSAPAEECQFGVYQRQSRLLNDFSQIALHLSPI
jgi:hypothetical protein